MINYIMLFKIKPIMIYIEQLKLEFKPLELDQGNKPMKQIIPNESH